MNTSKKITLATIKSFIAKSGNNLHFVRRTAFDGMQDMVCATGDTKLVKATRCEVTRGTQGVAGASFVGSSRDYFTRYYENGFEGFIVSNCVGSFILAVPVSI